ncbi:MAG: hypothetical protein AAFY04_01350, partial [Pseudomonadota bacterium]
LLPDQNGDGNRCLTMFIFPLFKNDHNTDYSVFNSITVIQGIGRSCAAASGPVIDHLPFQDKAQDRASRSVSVGGAGHWTVGWSADRHFSQ